MEPATVPKSAWFFLQCLTFWKEPKKENVRAPQYHGEALKRGVLISLIIFMVSLEIPEELFWRKHFFEHEAPLLRYNSPVGRRRAL